MERELDEELRFRLEMQTEENLRRGMSPEEARGQAVLLFGGVEGHREAARDVRGVGWLEDGARDARYAWRSLSRAPGFALAAVLTIGLGIGANTAIFGVVDALFLQPPAAVRNAEDVVRLYIARDEGAIRNLQGGAGSYVDHAAVRDRVPGLSATAAFFGARELDLGRGEDAQRIRASVVSGTFLPLMGSPGGAGT